MSALCLALGVATRPLQASVDLESGAEVTLLAANATELSVAPDGRAVAYNSAANRYSSDPQVLLAYLQMANCYDRLGDNGEAVSMLVQAKVILKQLPDEAFKSGNTNFSRKEWSEWLDWARQLRRTSENRPKLAQPVRGLM